MISILFANLFGGARKRRGTKQLIVMTARFETALRGARVHVSSQDRDLRYTWVYHPQGDVSEAQLLGRTDEELLSAAERDAVVALKRRVLESGTPEDCEVAFVSPHGRTLFALHVDPMLGPDGTIEGVMSAAVDISQTRLLESEQRRLTDELRAAVQRYETALRGSNVTVFTQDSDLIYTSVRGPRFGRHVEEIIGRSDDEILSQPSRKAVIP